MCMAMISDATPARRRGVAIMAPFLAMGLGAVSAGVLASFFTGPGEWRQALIICPTLSFGAAILCWIWLKEPAASLERRAAAAAGGIARQSQSPMHLFSPNHLVGTLMLWLLFICCIVVNTCLHAWLPAMLVGLDYEKGTAALAASAFSAGGLIGGLLIGPLIDRFGSSRTMPVFFVTGTILFLAVAAAMGGGASPQVLLTLIAIAGTFFLGGFGGANVMLTQFYSPALRAVGTGWAKSVGRVGTVAAPALVGVALAAGAGERDIMTITAIPAAAAALAAAVVGIRIRKQTRSAHLEAASPG